MNNQQAVVEQIVQNLAFEVEAVPKNKSIETTSISQSTPLNVKIKVRKKDEIHKQHDISSSIADDAPRAVRKIRLVNSDRTIMTFDVFMEAEFEKKPSRNLRKHIFDMLRPGMCLGAVDDEEYPYMPSSSYSANITEPSVANKSDGTLKQTFTLSKNVYQDYTVSTQPGGQKWLFGKCKPGGCLDPPFSEDKYSYKPSTRSGPERGEEELLEEEDVGSDTYSKKIPVIIPLRDEEAQSNGKHSSIFDSGLFKKKRKSSDKSTNTKLPDKTDSIVDIYPGKSATSSVSTHSNSIITYPPKVRSDPRISDDKTVRSRGPSEEKSRKSFNDHSEPYFIRPKGVNRIKEKKTLDPSDYPKQRSSDATDLKNSLKESFKMPVPLPIPIPVPIPIMSKNQKPEVIATNDNILKTQGDSANVTELDAIPDQKLQDQESLDAINLKDTDIPPRLLRDTSATENTDDKLAESSKIATLIPSNVEQPITPNEIDDQNLHEIKLQPLKEIDSENNIDDTAQPSNKTKTEPLKMPVPVPVPVIFSESNREIARDSKMINDNLQSSKIKLTQSKQSFQTKTTPPVIIDTPFEDSKDMQQNIYPSSGKSESTATATPKSQYSDIEADAIPVNYLRTRGGFSKQESDTEHPVTIAPNMEEDTKRHSKGEEITESLEKPAKQNYIKDKYSTATSAAPTATAIAIAAAAAATAAAVTATTAATKESSDIYEMPDTDTQPITGSPKKDERTDSQRVSPSKLPILIRSISILSGSKTSAASVKDKTKRSDSPDKYLDSVGHRASDLGVHEDEKQTSLSSGPTSAASVKDKTKNSDSPDKYLDNVGHRDTDLSVHKDEKRTSLSSGPTSEASVKDKTKRSDSPDKYLDNFGYRDTELGIHKDEKRTSLSSWPTSPASVKDKTNGSYSPEKHLNNAGHRDSDLGVHKDEKRTSLSSGPTSAASVKNKTNGSYSPEKHLNNAGHRDSDLGVHKDEKRTSLSSGPTSAASVKDKTKKSDRPDKYLDNVGHRDTDLSVHKDEKRTSLSSGPTLAASVKDKTKRSDSPDKYLDNVGYRDTDLGIHKDEKRTSLFSGPTSATSVKDKPKQSNSPDKHLDNAEHRDTDVGVHKDEKQTSLFSGPKYETDARDAKISEQPSDNEYFSETKKPNNDGKIDSYTESQARFTDVGSMNFIVAPVIIDNTEPTPNFQQHKEVYNETNLFDETINTGHEFDPSGVPFTTQMVSKFRKFDEDDGTHSTASRELIGTKSVIYDTDEYIPNSNAKKNPERISLSDKRVNLPGDTVISSIQSTSTLKSAMKKDAMSVELGFHSYLNDKNERILRTFDAANAPKRLPNDSVTVLKSQIRISLNEIRIPVDSEHDMSIQIKKANANQRVSISESGFVNVIDNGRVKKQRSPVQCSDADMKSSEAKTEVKKDNIPETDATDDHFMDYYEQELVPLQLIIKNLRDEIDVLAAQQLIFKDKLFCANKSKLPRLVHSNKKCFGCVRK